MSSDLRTLVDQEVELTHSELEDCFKQTHRILQTEYSRFAPGWVEYGHQVNKAVMSKVRAIIAAHEAKQATAQAVPSGWKLVPIEMTDEMRDAGNEFICNRYLLKSAYAAMLAATPAPAPAVGFELALGIRAFQGWKLTGNVIPVLYTDTINGNQVMRDDVWLCTTAALRSEAAAPAQEVGLTDGDLLNWIERQDLEELSMGVVIDAPHDGEYYVNGDDCVTHYGKTLRAAIIAALRAKGQS